MQWQYAAERADRIAGARWPADSWDGRAIRGILAVTLTGLARHLGRDPREVETGALLWHLDVGGAAWVRELGDLLELGAAAAEEWTWLTRQWPADPPTANAGEMPGGRGIARGSVRSAVEICTSWATSAVAHDLAAERQGWAPGTRVEVTAGEHAGRTGAVRAAAWILHDEMRGVRPGPPPGYEVTLDNSTRPTVRSEHLTLLG